MAGGGATMEAAGCWVCECTETVVERSAAKVLALGSAYGLNGHRSAYSPFQAQSRATDDKKHLARRMKLGRWRVWARRFGHIPLSNLSSQSAICAISVFDSGNKANTAWVSASRIDAQAVQQTHRKHRGAIYCVKQRSLEEI